MATVVVMPQLGNTVESCLVTSWHVGVGDHVEPDTIVADIETDKSVMDVPAGVSGTVLALLAAQGDEVLVKAPFFIVGEQGEDISGLLPDGSGASVEPTPAAESSSPSEPKRGLTESSDAPETNDSPGLIQESQTRSAEEGTWVRSMSPRARRLADQAGVDLTSIVGTGPHWRVTSADVEGAIKAKRAGAESDGVEETSDGLIAQEPAASVPMTRAAQALGTPAWQSGTGLGGRVTRDDLQSPQEPDHAEQPDNVPVAEPVSDQPEEPTVVTDQAAGSDREGSDAQEVPPSTNADFPGSFTDTPLKGIRKLVAQRMQESLSNHAQLTFDSSAPATSLLSLRSELKVSDPAMGMNEITIGDLVSYAAMKVLAKHPMLNSTVEDGVVRTYDSVHLGVAVDTPRGLVVPTVRFAERMGIKEFSLMIRTLAEQARTGKIDPDLLAGATFTVTNLGAYGIESFTPILNSAQVAILGVNAITPRPVVKADGTMGVEQRISFSLTVDHAIIDGADAARYLKDLVAYVKSIYVSMMD